MAVRIEDAGFEIRDMIAWVYSTGFPKSHNLKDEWQGWGTALKPALEPITVARKPLIGTVAQNVLEHGTGAINVDGCRVGTQGGTRKSGPPSYKAGTSLAGSLDGSLNGGGCESINAGRWPANLIHDGSEEVVELFPITTSGKPMKKMHTDPGRNVASGASKGGQYFHDGYGDSGSAARFFYCAKASKKDRDEGCEKIEPQNNMRVNGPRESEDDKHSTKRSNCHPTVKPTDLMRYLCRLVTQPNGVVLDPFMGSGSTGKAAMIEGFQFIGIERDESYFEIARSRIEAASERLL
jgi:site-specific DNA-methyltransferase (adenine-specific)